MQLYNILIIHQTLRNVNNVGIERVHSPNQRATGWIIFSYLCPYTYIICDVIQ